MGAKNIDLNFLQDYQYLCLGISILLLFALCPMLYALTAMFPGHEFCPLALIRDPGFPLSSHH